MISGRSILAFNFIYVNQKSMNFQTLAKGDIIDIISPATACTKSEINCIKDFVKTSGFQPRIFLEKETTLTKPTHHEFPSFDPKTRFEQLQDALLNNESKAIWCTRGGYGSADLLPYLQKMPKPKNNKIFIGFSDLVSLTTHFQQHWNWPIICGPMLAQMARGDISKKSQKAIVDLLYGKNFVQKFSLTNLSSKTKTFATLQITQDSQSSHNIHGEIVGGCISVLAGHFGTKNQLNWHNKILFLEDEGEDGERLERYFNHIITIMVETKKYPKAIILGNFLKANPHGSPQAKNIHLAITKLVEKLISHKLKTPVFIENSQSLGHSKNMLPLVLGVNYQIELHL